jgi:hypothetical protein
MVDRSCCCIGYLIRKRGGTKSTIDYCKTRNVPFINLAQQV